MNQITKKASPLMLRGWKMIAEAVGTGTVTAKRLAASGYFGGCLKEDPRDGRPIILKDDLVRLVESFPPYNVTAL